MSKTFFGRIIDDISDTKFLKTDFIFIVIYSAKIEWHHAKSLHIRQKLAQKNTENHTAFGVWE